MLFVRKNNAQHSNKLLGKNPEILLLRLKVRVYLPPGIKKKNNHITGLARL